MNAVLIAHNYSVYRLRRTRGSGFHKMLKSSVFVYIAGYALRAEIPRHILRVGNAVLRAAQKPLASLFRVLCAAPALQPIAAHVVLSLSVILKRGLLEPIQRLFIVAQAVKMPTERVLLRRVGDILCAFGSGGRELLRFFESHLTAHSAAHRLDSLRGYPTL